MKTVRIFISSPGDVGAEREKAREIFERLQSEFSGLIEIAPYFWEHEPMRADTDFQSQIEPPSTFDVFICLLWARLGSRLHPGLHQKPGGGEYASGTEYELLDALEAFRRSSAPEVLIYKRHGDPVIPAKPKEERERILSQYDALESFFARLTQEDGHFVVGTNSYGGLEQFETKFEGDMRKVLARFLPEGVAGSHTVPKSWAAGSPFRGLRHFDFEHAPIFFGRTRAIDEVLAALRQQAADERAFILVFGGSGVGKSSLVCAGAMPWLVKPGVIDGVGLWRRAVMRPNEVNEGDLFDALATSLMRPEGLPEIGNDGTTVTQLAAMLRDKPESVGMLIKGALSQAAREVQLAEKLEKQPRALVALAVDQMEELFTIERLADQREAFLRAIDALARSGYVWVLATLRSDFYPRCEESPLLMELKKGAGQYHLQPPDEAQLGQMIRLPASAAGLLFEEDHKTGERLDDILRDAGVKSPGALPLLEFALEELYEQRDKDKGLLRLEAYRALGGVEGALGKRAEESFQHVGAGAQESFDLVFRQLVTISAGEGEPAVRRRALKNEVETTAGTRELIAGLTADRLLVADRTEEGAIVIGLAHEAMLSSWPRLAQWVLRNRESLKVRAQVAADSNRWIENNRNPDYLYDAGLPLEKARAARREGFLDQHETEFVEVSGRNVAAVASRRVRALRRWLMAVAVVAIIAVGTGVLAWKKKREAVAAKKAADSLINYMQHDLSNKLAKLGYLSVMQSLNAKIRKYHEDHPAEAGDLEAEGERGIALDQQGDVLKGQGDLDRALKSYRESLAIFAKLSKQDPANTAWQHYLAVSHTKVGDVQRASFAGLPGALQSYRDSLAILEKLTKQNPRNTDWVRDLAIGYKNVGDLLRAQGGLQDLFDAFDSYLKGMRILARSAMEDNSSESLTSTQYLLAKLQIDLGDVHSLQHDLPKALDSYRSGFDMLNKAAKAEPANAAMQRELSLIYARIGVVLRRQGDFPRALQSCRDSFAIAERLTQQDPSNAEWYHDLSVAYVRVGDVLMAEKDLPGALRNYRDGLAMAKELTKNSSNADWWYDFSAAYAKVGDVLRAQKDLPGALQSYRDSLNIAQLWAKMDVAMSHVNSFPASDSTPSATQYTSNAVRQHELSRCYLRVGDVLSDQGNLPEALKSYREGLAIAEKVTEAEPLNYDFQMNVSILLGHVAQTILASPHPDRAEAQRLIEKGLSVLQAEWVKPIPKLQKETREWLEGLRKKAKE